MVSELIEQLKVRQGTKANCYIKHDLKPLDAPVTVRIKFAKTGSLQYISHLDLQRLWSRAFVRAGIPLWYTKGFNPHAKMVFGIPLPVGVQSVCELIDVRIDKEISCEDIKELLNEALTDELKILDAYLPQTKFSEITKADYSIELVSPNASKELAKNINEFFAKDEIMMTKKTKSGEKEINIVKLIYNLKADYMTNGNVEIKARLAAGTESLNPEFIISALRKNSILPAADLDVESYEIIRECVLNANDEVFR